MTDQIELTPRQAETVELLVQGLTYSQIAGEMDISTRTVEKHIYDVASMLDGNGSPRARVLFWYLSEPTTRPYSVRE